MVTRAGPPPAALGAAAGRPPGADEQPDFLAGAPQRDRRVSDVAIVLGPAALALGLSLIEITSRSLGFDEGATVTIAAQHGAALNSAIAHDGGNMSGYYLALHALMSVFGNSLLAVRLPSAIATTATAGLVVALSRRLFDRRVAWVAGLLTAVSLPLVYWGQNARGYAPMVAFTVAAFLSLVVLVDRAPGRFSPVVPWAGFVLFTALAIYSSFVAVLVVPAQVLTVLWYRRMAKPLALALAAVTACCIPLIVLAFGRGSGQLFWLPRPTFKGEMEVFQALTGAGLQPNFHPPLSPTPLLVVTLLALLAVAVVIVARVLPGPRDRDGWAQGLVLAWLVFPVAFAWIESYFGQPILLPRNLLAAAPAVAILLALGFTNRRLPGPIALACLLAVVALRLVALVPSYGVSPEDWRGATAHVLAGARPGDCIAFYPSDGRMAFRYYLARGTGARGAVAPAPRPVLPSAPWNEVKAYVEDYSTPSPSRLGQIAAGCPRMWLISSHIGETTGPAGSLAHRARFFALSAAVSRRYPHRHSVKFGYASAVYVELAAR
jgi:mannosyltransferase